MTREYHRGSICSRWGSCTRLLGLRQAPQMVQLHAPVRHSWRRASYTRSKIRMDPSINVWYNALSILATYAEGRQCLHLPVNSFSDLLERAY
jgi:hypothetical protein